MWYRGGYLVLFTLPSKLKKLIVAVRVYVVTAAIRALYGEPNAAKTKLLLAMTGGF
jgi:hypothetical protein